MRWAVLAPALAVRLGSPPVLASFAEQGALNLTATKETIDGALEHYDNKWNANVTDLNNTYETIKQQLESKEIDSVEAGIANATDYLNSMKTKIPAHLAQMEERTKVVKEQLKTVPAETMKSIDELRAVSEERLETAEQKFTEQSNEGRVQFTDSIDASTEKVNAGIRAVADNHKEHFEKYEESAKDDNKLFQKHNKMFQNERQKLHDEVVDPLLDQLQVFKSSIEKQKQDAKLQLDDVASTHSKYAKKADEEINAYRGHVAKQAENLGTEVEKLLESEGKRFGRKSNSAKDQDLRTQLRTERMYKMLNFKSNREIKNVGNDFNKLVIDLNKKVSDADTDKDNVEKNVDALGTKLVDTYGGVAETAQEFKDDFGSGGAMDKARAALLEKLDGVYWQKNDAVPPSILEFKNQVGGEVGELMGKEKDEVMGEGGKLSTQTEDIIRKIETSFGDFTSDWNKKKYEFAASVADSGDSLLDPENLYKKLNDARTAKAKSDIVVQELEGINLKNLEKILNAVAKKRAEMENDKKIIESGISEQKDNYVDGIMYKRDQELMNLENWIKEALIKINTAKEDILSKMKPVEEPKDEMDEVQQKVKVVEDKLKDADEEVGTREKDVFSVLKEIAEVKTHASEARKFFGCTNRTCLLRGFINNMADELNTTVENSHTEADDALTTFYANLSSDFDTDADEWNFDKSKLERDRIQHWERLNTSLGSIQDLYYSWEGATNNETAEASRKVKNERKDAEELEDEEGELRKDAGENLDNAKDEADSATQKNGEDFDEAYQKGLADAHKVLLAAKNDIKNMTKEATDYTYRAKIYAMKQQGGAKKKLLTADNKQAKEDLQEKIEEAETATDDTKGATNELEKEAKESEKKGEETEKENEKAEEAATDAKEAAKDAKINVQMEYQRQNKEGKQKVTAYVKLANKPFAKEAQDIEKKGGEKKRSIDLDAERSEALVIEGEADTKVKTTKLNDDNVQAADNVKSLIRGAKSETRAKSRQAEAMILNVKKDFDEMQGTSQKNTEWIKTHNMGVMLTEAQGVQDKVSKMGTQESREMSVYEEQLYGLLASLNDSMVFSDLYHKLDQLIHRNDTSVDRLQVKVLGLNDYFNTLNQTLFEDISKNENEFNDVESKLETTNATAFNKLFNVENEVIQFREDMLAKTTKINELNQDLNSEVDQVKADTRMALNNHSQDYQNGYGEINTFLSGFSENATFGDMISRTTALIQDADQTDRNIFDLIKTKIEPRIGLWRNATNEFFGGMEIDINMDELNSLVQNDTDVVSKLMDDGRTIMALDRIERRMEKEQLRHAGLSLSAVLSKLDSARNTEEDSSEKQYSMMIKKTKLSGQQVGMEAQTLIDVIEDKEREAAKLSDEVQSMKKEVLGFLEQKGVVQDSTDFELDMKKRYFDTKMQKIETGLQKMPHVGSTPGGLLETARLPPVQATEQFRRAAAELRRHETDDRALEDDLAIVAQS